MLQYFVCLTTNFSPLCGLSAAENLRLDSSGDDTEKLAISELLEVLSLFPPLRNILILLIFLINVILSSRLLLMNVKTVLYLFS